MNLVRHLLSRGGDDTIFAVAILLWICFSCAAAKRAAGEPASPSRIYLLVFRELTNQSPIRGRV
jgi:hypothetical protein